MSKEEFDDETLMAFADGELDEATSLRVEAALAEDEALAERLAVFFDSRVLVASTLKPLIDEPVPEALAASVRKMAEDAQNAAAKEVVPASDTVVAFRPRPSPKTVSANRWLMPLAASILAVVTGVGGFVAGRSGVGEMSSIDVAIAAALDSQPSGGDVSLGDDGSALHLVSSFNDGRGAFCREYELRRETDTTATVACRQDGGWVTRLALSSPRTEGYVPASAQETIDAYLASIEAAAPLGADEEKKILSGSGE